MEGVLSNAAYEMNRERMGLYEQQLYSSAGEPFLEYLIEARGLTTQTIKHFHLGAVIDPDPVDNFAQGRICIPHLNNTGPRVLRFRAMPGQDGPKYWQPSGSSVGVFNVTELLNPHTQIVVTEGEIDCMILWQCGIPAIGFPGAQSWKDYHRYLLEGYQQVTITVDNDDQGAGQSFADKVASKVQGPRPILMPAGHDVASYYTDAGRDALLAHLRLKDAA